MDSLMLKSAMFYHNEGLCCIPIIPHDKRPAIDWEEYHTRCSTTDEVKEWFGNGHNFNLGIVHGEVSGNYVAIDIDHDAGILERLKGQFPYLFRGRIEQSGSGEGYHIPLRVKELPDFGLDSKHNRPRGNRTWKTPLGIANIRAQFCQTVSPPSIHPTGRRYKFIQKGQLAQVDSLSPVLDWLDSVLPSKPEKKAPVKKSQGQPGGDSLVEAVTQVWSDPLTVFQEFGLANEIKVEPNGELRLLGNGGLLVTDDRQRWYCFSDEMGGGLFEAWGWIRLGSAYDKHKHFRQILLEMAEAGGIDLSQYQKKREPEQPKVEPVKSKFIWTPTYKMMWERVR